MPGPRRRGGIALTAAQQREDRDATRKLRQAGRGQAGAVSGRADAWLYQRLKPQLMSQGRGCSYCLRELSEADATVDHIIPYRDGGPPSLKNLRLACEPCNLVRDALMTGGQSADPQGPEIVSVYATALLLLGRPPQGRGRLAAAGIASWRSLAPALDWLVRGGLAGRGASVPPSWHATQAGLVLARAVRGGARNTAWLRAVLGDPALVQRARCSALTGDPLALARHVDDCSPGGLGPACCCSPAPASRPA